MTVSSEQQEPNRSGDCFSIVGYTVHFDTTTTILYCCYCYTYPFFEKTIPFYCVMLPWSFPQIPFPSIVKFSQLLHQSWDMDIVIVIKVTKPSVKGRISTEKIRFK